MGQTKKALVIGVSDYENLPTLKFCRNDGQKIYEILKSLNYEIPEKRKLVGKIMHQEIEDSIYDFFSDKANSPKDTLLFYYSGHGVPEGNGEEHYLASYEIDSEQPFRKGFSFDILTKAIDRSIPRSKVIILDCCYSGSAKLDSKGADSANNGARLGTLAIHKKIAAGGGKCILAACQASQEAFKMVKGDYSLFTNYIIKGLSHNGDSINKDGNVTPDSLSNYVYDQILSLPPKIRPRQLPIRKVEGFGDIILASYPDLATSSSQGDPTWFLDQGINLYMEGDYTNAVISFDKAIDKDNNFADAYTSKGYVLTSQRKDAEAIKCFDKAIELITNDESLWRNKAFCLINLDRYDEAIKCFDKALEINPDHAEAWYGKGFVMIKTANYDKAMSFFDKAIEIDPKYSEAWHAKGLILNYLRKFKEALPYYDKAIKILPNSRTTLYGKAFALVSLEMYDEAMKCFEKINRVNSADEYGWFGRAFALTYLERYNESIYYYDEALNRNPNSKLLFYGKAFVLINLKRFDEALIYFDKCIGLDQRYLDAWHGKAFALLNQGKHAESMECFNKILTMSPGDDLASRGNVYANNGSWLVLNG